MTERNVLKREFSAIGLTLFAVFLGGALAFQRVPPGGGCLDATGAFGPIGTYSRCALVTTVGIPGAMLGGVVLGLIETLAGTYLPLFTNDVIGNEYKFDPATLTDSQLLAHAFGYGDLADLAFAGD